MKNKKGTIFIVSVTCLLIGIILLYTSHALFTTPTIEKSAITIKAGTMDPTIKVDGVITNKLTVAAGEEKVFTVTVENLNSITGRFLFYYTGSIQTDVAMGYLDGTGLNQPSANSFVLSPNGKKTYSIKVKNSSTSSQTITLGGIGGLESFSLTMPSGAKAISSYCFTFSTSSGTITDYKEDASCPKDVVIPNTINEVSVIAIGNRAFYQDQLTSVTIPDNITTIERSAFSRNQLTSVTIGNNVTKIEAEAFYQNQLTSVMIPDNVTTIGNSAFAYNRLTSVTIGNNVTSIGEYAFFDNQLTSVTIPDSVTTIGDLAFTSNRLTNVIIPDSVKTIGEMAFWGNSLTNITISNSVTTIGERAFESNKLTSIEIPTSVISIGNAAFNDNQLPDEQAFIYKRNNDGSIDYTTLVSYGGAKKNDVIIPNNVTSIEKSACSWSSLTSVVISDSVINIGDSAFATNQLTEVTVGRSVTSIGIGAFEKGTTDSFNKNLTKIINKTGREFDWKEITGGSSAATFVAGIIPHSAGDITVTSE